MPPPSGKSSAPREIVRVMILQKNQPIRERNQPKKYLRQKKVQKSGKPVYHSSKASRPEQEREYPRSSISNAQQEHPHRMALVNNEDRDAVDRKVVSKIELEVILKLTKLTKGNGPL